MASSMSLTPAQQAVVAQQRQMQKAQNAQFGRFGATELLAQAICQNNLAAPATYNLGNFVTLDRPLAGFVLVFSGRLVIGTAAYDAGAPESFTNLIQNILVQGQHVLWGAQQIWNISGATLFVLPQTAQSRNANVFLSSTTRQEDPGQPYVQQANMITTPATGTVDFWISYWMPTFPLLGATPTGKRQAIPTFLRAEDWTGPLLFNITVGDKTALGTPNASTATTFSSFGSASGSPLLQLFGVYSQLGTGPARYAYVPGSNLVVLRNEAPFPNLLTGATAQQTLAAQLQAAITTGMLIKSGINLTGTSAGVTTFSSLSDVQLDQTAIKIGNKFIKNNNSNLAMKAYAQGMMNCNTPQGYLWLPFDESGNMFNAFRFDLVAANLNANPQLVTAVLSGNSNNRQQYIQEQVFSASGQKAATSSTPALGAFPTQQLPV